MIRLSRSHLETVARCKRKFYYRYLLGLEEQSSSQSASEGTLIHEGLRAAFQAVLDRRAENLTAVAVKAVADMVARGTAFYRGEEYALAKACQEQESYSRVCDVVQYYVEKQMLKDLENAEVVAVEKNFVFPLTPDIELEGTLDLVLKRQVETSFIYEVYDHKSVSDVHKALDFLRLDVQMHVYEWLANNVLAEEYIRDQVGAWDGPVEDLLLEVPQVEMVYNLIRREVPPGYGTRELRRNKDGSISKLNASQDQRDYLKQWRFSHDDGERSHVLAQLEYDAAEANVMLRYSSEAGLKLFKMRGGRTVIKTGGEACNFCPYFERCSAELVGHSEPNWKLPDGEASSSPLLRL